MNVFVEACLFSESAYAHCFMQVPASLVRWVATPESKNMTMRWTGFPHAIGLRIQGENVWCASCMMQTIASVPNCCRGPLRAQCRTTHPTRIVDSAVFFPSHRLIEFRIAECSRSQRASAKRDASSINRSYESQRAEQAEDIEPQKDSPAHTQSHPSGWMHARTACVRRCMPAGRLGDRGWRDCSTMIDGSRTFKGF